MAYPSLVIGMTARLVIAMTVIALSAAAQAVEIKLLASAGIKSACLELLPQFEKETGHKVAALWSSSRPIRKRVEAGEVADLVILGDSQTEELTAQGKLDGSTRAIFGRSGIAVALRSSAATPDISSPDSLKRSVLGARSIAYSLGLSGTYLVGMFRTLGIEEEIKSKLVTVKPSEPVGEVVPRGDAEIGFHQLSELLPVKGIQIVGMLPPDLQHFTVFSGAVHSEANQPVAAKALLSFLTASAATESIKKHGLDR